MNFAKYLVAHIHFVKQIIFELSSSQALKFYHYLIPDAFFFSFFDAI